MRRCLSIDSNEVALDDGSGDVFDPHAVVARYDVALGGSGPPMVDPPTALGTTEVGAASGDRSSRVRADEAALQPRPRPSYEDVATEAVDDETPYRHAFASGDEAVAESVALAREFAADFDQENGVVARDLRVRARARLCVAVDDHVVLDAHRADRSA